MDYLATVSLSLQMLDLSFNNLSSEDFANLGLLPKLRVLHLTGNNLKDIPGNLAGYEDRSVCRHTCKSLCGFSIEHEFFTTQPVQFVVSTCPQNFTVIIHSLKVGELTNKYLRRKTILQKHA